MSGWNSFNIRSFLETGETTKLFEYVKCLETAKNLNPLNIESILKQKKQQKTFLGTYINTFMGFGRFPVSGNIPYSRDLVFFAVSRPSLQYSRDFVVSQDKIL